MKHYISAVAQRVLAGITPSRPLTTPEAKADFEEYKQFVAKWQERKRDWDKLAKDHSPTGRKEFTRLVDESTAYVRAEMKMRREFLAKHGITIQNWS